MLQLQQLGFTNRQLSESHHYCHVNRSEILAALSSGHHESGKKKGTSNNAPASDGDRLDYFKSCMAETRRSGAKKKKERNEWMPAPSGDFSFFPNWGIESRILLSYKPLSLSHHPRDVGHFQPPGPLPQIEGTSLVQRRWRQGSHLYELICWCGPKQWKLFLNTRWVVETERVVIDTVKPGYNGKGSRY